MLLDSSSTPVEYVVSVSSVLPAAAAALEAASQLPAAGAAAAAQRQRLEFATTATVFRYHFCSFLCSGCPLALSVVATASCMHCDRDIHI